MGCIDMSSKGSQDDLFQKVARVVMLSYMKDSIALDSTRKFLGNKTKYGQKQTINTGIRDEAVKICKRGSLYVFLQGNWAYPIIKKINPYMGFVIYAVSYIQ